MNLRFWACFGLIVAMALISSPAVAELTKAQAQTQNTSSKPTAANATVSNATAQNAPSPQQKNIKMVVNWTDHTVKIINATTNETISVRHFTFNAGNATGNQTTGVNASASTPSGTNNTSQPANITSSLTKNQSSDITEKMKALQTGK